MVFQLCDVGAADNELVRDTHAWWQDAAEKAGINVSGFDRNAPLNERIAWALGQGLDIGVIYSRFSSKRQHSTSDQVRTCIQHAAANNIYCPPEFLCVDEAQRGYRTRREGLDRMLLILKHRHATVLLVFKASRLYRQAFKGYQLIQQEVVEEGLRAISVTQGIDTADTKAWRMLIQMHGMMDDLVIEATADHVRAGLKGLFARGYTVGALPVGYRRKELPEAPVTNRGLTRTVPEIDNGSPDSDEKPDAAAMIVRHYELIRDGLPIKQGWRKWVADGGPADPRSSHGVMLYPAYRRMLSRIAYTGRFEFGRTRNEYSTKRDYSRQWEQPESEVDRYHCEELRIISDELYFEVQKLLAKLKSGPRGPRKQKPLQLWDLVTDCFFCAACSTEEKLVRMYQSGAQGNGMACKNSALCQQYSIVRRDKSIRAVCNAIAKHIAGNESFLQDTVRAAINLNEHSDDGAEKRIQSLQQQVRVVSARVSDLSELAGQGSLKDRSETKARIRKSQADRAALEAELASLKARTSRVNASFSPENAMETLVKLSALMEDGAAGKLGADAVHHAVSAFKLLTGGKILVVVEPRPARKQSNVRGVFTVNLLAGLQADLEGFIDTNDGEEISVWLRQPPKIDRLASRVHMLIDDNGHSFRSAATALKADGCNVESAFVWQAYQRYYEMIGETVPDRPYNNGNPRRTPR